MTTPQDSAQDSAQSLPWSVAVLLITAVSSTYLFNHRGALGAAISKVNITASLPTASKPTRAHLSLKPQIPVELCLPICVPGDRPTLHRLLDSARRIIGTISATIGKIRIGDFRVPLLKFGNLYWPLIISTVPPVLLLLLSRQYLDCWVARYQIYVATTLHLLLRIGLGPEPISARELVSAALVMVSFDMFQRALDWEAKTPDKSEHSVCATSASETPLARLRSEDSVLVYSDSSVSSNRAKNCQTIADPDSGAPDTIFSVAGSKDEMVRLQVTLTDLKTANKAKEVLLRRTREELKNARETLNETFGEYCSLRDEMKNIKQSMARDHQAVVYRKDIELFALRKGNEQKEKYIKEHDTKLEDIFQQQKATVELKDAQLKVLKERLSVLERQGSPRFSHEYEEAMDGDHALEVRLLKVKKPAKRTENDGSVDLEVSRVSEEKEATIKSLREQLAVAKKAAAEVVNQQAELTRAWDIVKKAQSALKEERKLHAQTREQLEELTVKFEEEQQRNCTQPTSRLPTIDEDKDELEAMFDKTQEDNLRLYAELESLESRLREANSRMFNAEQEATALREHANLEKLASSDTETARPSVIHHVHFQKMEGQLKESRELYATKAAETEALKNTISGKNDYIKDLQNEIDAAVGFHTQDQDEIERLKQAVTELQATKEQLMRDHERLAVQRTRLRISSTEHTSARSSGATLIQEMSPPLTKSPAGQPPTETLSTVPDQVEDVRNNSIQETPKRHIRSESTPNRWNLMTTEVPPPELRGLRRRSLGLKDFMKKMVKRDLKAETTLDVVPAQGVGGAELPPNRAALSTKDKNAMMRPTTAAPGTGSGDPFYDIPKNPEPHRPATVSRHTPRYYAAKDAKDETRPQTASGDKKASKDDMATSTKRRSWVASNKLKRRSLY